MIAPNTVVHLLNVPIEEDQQNQMDFASVGTQTAYFISKVVLGQSYANGDFTYQRKDNIIRIPAEYDALQSVNYVMYQNTYYNNKWFYAFVTKKEYINANMTALYIKTDVFQTWQFDWVLKQSMIERMTTASDNIGEFCQPEPLNVQAYPVDRVTLGKCSIGMSTQNPILFFSENPSALEDDPPIRVGFNSGAITMEYGKIYNSIYDPQLSTDLGLLEDDGQLEMISNIGIGFYGDLPVSQDSTTTKTFVKEPVTPMNNKTYNYCYGVVLGTSSYKLTVQQLKKHTFDYNAEGWWGTSPFVVLNLQDIPNATVDYRGIPIPSIVMDAYQNAMNHRIAELDNTQIAHTFCTGMRALVSSGNPGKALKAGAQEYFKIEIDKLETYLDREANKDLEPSQVTGYAAPSSNFAAGFGGIWLIRFAPTPEEFKRVDDFFSMFGYAINRIDMPKFKNRTYWDYLKTMDINIDGNIPQDDVEELKSIFNKGITVWHGNSASNTNWCDYSHINTIVQ